MPGYFSIFWDFVHGKGFQPSLSFLIIFYHSSPFFLRSGGTARVGREEFFIFCEPLRFTGNELFLFFCRAITSL